MKKVVLILLLLAGYCSLAFPQDGTCGENLVWTLSNDTLTIRPAEGTSGGPMEDYTSKTSPWANMTTIKRVYIEDGVTSIGNDAFYYCRGLTSVRIPNSVTSIGSSAFWGCDVLTSVTIPNGVTTIGSSAFILCRGLTSVTIPNSVTTIGSSAFKRCDVLTSVTIPNGVTTIGSSTFEHCRCLTSVTLPESVTSIGMAAFYACRGLTSVTIPNSVTTIRSSAFNGCSGLTSVTIGESVTTIESAAFSGCRGLKKITNYRRTPIGLYSSVFSGSDITEIQLVVPAGCGAAYQQAEVWRDFQIVELPFAPEFSKTEDVVTCGTRVSIDCASSDAVIYYGIGKDAEPTLLYEEGISVTVTDTTYICAVAQRGEERSEVVRVTYFADHTSFLNAHEAVAPTCTEEGRKAYWECGRCEKLFSDAEATTEISEPEVIDALGHDLTAHEAVAPTCTEEGRKAYWECGRCEKLFSDAGATTEIAEPEVIDALGHDLTAHEGVAATCTKEGRKAYWECGRCEKLFSDAEATTEISEPEEIAATGHAYNQPVWSWTEDYQASVTFTCLHCSHEERPNVTVKSEITLPATSTREGERTYTATTVFEGETYTDTKTELIPIEPTATEATVLVEGVKIYPNPSRGEFKVELPIDAQVEIFDVSGKKVLAQICSAGTHGFGLAQTGIYVLKVSAGGQQATFRLVVR